MEMVYRAAGKCEMVTVKLVPLISSRNAAALSAVAPSMVMDALSLRCANSPLTRTSWPQEAQISSAAKAAGAENHKLPKVIREMAATSVARLRWPDGLRWTDSRDRNSELR